MCEFFKCSVLVWRNRCVLEIFKCRPWILCFEASPLILHLLIVNAASSICTLKMGKHIFSVSSIHKGGLPKKRLKFHCLSKISPYTPSANCICLAAQYTWFFVYFASNSGPNFVLTQLKFAPTHPNFALTLENCTLNSNFQ